MCSVRKNTKLVPNNTAEGKLSVGLAQRVSCVVQKNTEVVPNKVMEMQSSFWLLVFCGVLFGIIGKWFRIKF